MTTPPDAALPLTSAHKRLFEYDGSYKCLDCRAQWGALPGAPEMPSECVPYRCPHCDDPECNSSGSMRVPRCYEREIASLRSSPIPLLLSTLPPHKCSLSITHNEHLNYYETAEQYIITRDFAHFADDAARQRSMDTNEIWEMQWYPDTPAGFYVIAAPTLAELLELASKHHE